jgi:hypothetical protein
LLKLLHRLHSLSESSWAAWVQENADIVSMDGLLASDHWDSLHNPLSAYQDLTTVALGNGRTTSFWHDAWLPSG